MSKRTTPRILGPYAQQTTAGERWRLVELDSRGRRTSTLYPTEHAAQTAKARAESGRHAEAERTVAVAVAAFVAAKVRAQAWSDLTLARTGNDLDRFAESVGERVRISSLTADDVRHHLEVLSPLALASQRSRYHAVAEFLRWCTRKGWIDRCPCDDLDPGELPWRTKRARRMLGRGKPQLRNAGEVREYLRAAATYAYPEHRVASILPLCVGLSSGEVRHLRVGDVDLVAGKLWIRGDAEKDDDLDDDAWDVKSDSRRRTVEILPDFRDDLALLCKDRDPSALLFFDNDREPKDGRWLNRLIAGNCKVAGTRLVTSHGLRGTYSTMLAALANVPIADIARALGHADLGATARGHYVGSTRHDQGLRI